MSVTITELKIHLRITGTSEDTILQTYLDGALGYIESQTGRKLSQESGRKAYFDQFGDMELIGDDPIVESVKYIDNDGVEQTLSASVYEVKTHKARPYITLAYGQSWPSIRAVDAAITITYQSGYTATTLPARLRSAVLLEAATNYEYREDETMTRNHNNRGAVDRLTWPSTVTR